jgi:hypothetical protein
VGVHCAIQLSKHSAIPVLNFPLGQISLVTQREGQGVDREVVACPALEFKEAIRPHLRLPFFANGAVAYSITPHVVLDQGGRLAGGSEELEVRQVDVLGDHAGRMVTHAQSSLIPQRRRYLLSDVWSTSLARLRHPASSLAMSL